MSLPTQLRRRLDYLHFPSEAELLSLQPSRRDLEGWLAGPGLHVTDAAVEAASRLSQAVQTTSRVREATVQAAGMDMRAIVHAATEALVRRVVEGVAGDLEAAVEQVTDALIEAA
jgi:hypothetical protein